MTQQGGVENVSVRGAWCVVANDVVHVPQDPIGAPRRVSIRVSETKRCQQKPRHCFASVNRYPVDKVAIQEGDILRNALPAAVDTADLLSPCRHPEEQPLDMASGLTKATKDQVLVG